MSRIESITILWRTGSACCMACRFCLQQGIGFQGKVAPQSGLQFALFPGGAQG